MANKLTFINTYTLKQTRLQSVKQVSYFQSNLQVVHKRIAQSQINGVNLQGIKTTYCLIQTDNKTDGWH